MSEFMLYGVGYLYLVRSAASAFEIGVSTFWLSYIDLYRTFLEWQAEIWVSLRVCRRKTIRFINTRQFVNIGLVL